MTRRLRRTAAALDERDCPGSRVPEETSGLYWAEAGSGFGKQVTGRAALPRGIKGFGDAFLLIRYGKESKMEYLIGIDLGTSGSMTALHDQTGKVISSASLEYPMFQEK